MSTLQTLWQDQKAIIIAAIVALLAAASCLKVVDETTQAVIVRLGQPDRVVNRFKPDADFGQTGAGVIWRIPFMEQVVEVDRRILDLDMERQQVLSADQRRLEVDAFARFRIIDPVRMVQTAGTTDRLAVQLQPILNSALRQELGKRTFDSLLTADRGRAMEQIRQGLDREAREYGAQIIDVRIKRADLPEGTPLESAFTRMATARQQEAATIRAQGQKQAQIIRATAEATAAKTYADAFNKDPAFYDFYRAMQSYDVTFAQKGSSTSIVLSPDNEYLKQFKGK
ncbi:MAG: protease modulator HflC [Novosphingobium sp. 28-62-57]|uniref:protease modulator HflC n=1 Tax=unclassified Novosphingobium TaxID=2644732 RepID=UPI000BD801E3|nr:MULTISPECIES: protease modulator HflC [unclassified Novosphingobium]OYW50449.1 MAG: protease modulator HflC [Novosphingobium sp. 12-62-10]OYZ11448.1 MAG: protease modulator HflC [Novosphingobium sp. 28-62-57]OZA31466.1 MAG: protease modulator HflC [Novosphingobium sp. 17-62-9]